MSDANVRSIAVYVCTHQRNEPLLSLIDSVRLAAKRVQPDTQIALVVVDDNPDGSAASAIEGQDEGFELGLHYVHCGAQNISDARNMGIEKCLELGDWVAMVDDDQTVVENWFVELIKIQAETAATAVTGPVYLRYSDQSPAWLSNEPFSEILEAPTKPDASTVGLCSTGNSMLHAQFLIDNPDIRFRSDLGRVGGEDMVFFRAAVASGLEARYAAHAVCYGEQPPERSNLPYQLRASYWMGNTEYVTNFESGSASRARMTLRAGRRFVSYTSRSIKRLIAGEGPQLRFLMAGLAQSLGIFVGALGVRVNHS